MTEQDVPALSVGIQQLTPVEGDPDYGKTAADLWNEVSAEDDTEVKPAPAKAAAGETEEDVLDETTEEVEAEGEAKPDDKKTEVDPVQARIDALENLIKSSVGRIGSLQSELVKLKEQPPAAKAPSEADVKAATKSPEKWDKLKGEYPDFTEAVEEFVSSRAQPGVDPAKLLEQSQSFALTKTREAHVATQKAMADLAEPDWYEVGTSEAFAGWLLKQPEERRKSVAEASENWNAVVVVKAVRDFKKTQTQQRVTKNASQGRLAAAVVPTGTSKTPTPRGAAKTAQEIWAELDAEDRAAARR